MFWKLLKFQFSPPFVDTTKLNDSELVCEVAYLIDQPEIVAFKIACGQAKIPEDEMDELWVQFYFGNNILHPDIRLEFEKVHVQLITNNITRPL